MIINLIFKLQIEELQEVSTKKYSTIFILPVFSGESEILSSHLIVLHSLIQLNEQSLPWIWYGFRIGITCVNYTELIHICYRTSELLI